VVWRVPKKIAGRAAPDSWQPRGKLLLVVLLVLAAVYAIHRLHLYPLL
jgi:flagellar biogenesis protein FliO